MGEMEIGDGDGDWRLEMEIGDGDWRLEMEIEDGDWRWRLEMEIGDGDWRWRWELEKTLKPLEIWVEGLCLVTTLLSCEVCDEHFEKKSGLKGCVWSLHCCLVKYVMNSLKRNLG